MILKNYKSFLESRVLLKNTEKPFEYNLNEIEGLTMKINSILVYRGYKEINYTDSLYQNIEKQDFKSIKLKLEYIGINIVKKGNIYIIERKTEKKGKVFSDLHI